jgi:hypothetical protein
MTAHPDRAAAVASLVETAMAQVAPLDICVCGAPNALHHREGHDNGSSRYYVCEVGHRWGYSTYASDSSRNFWRYLGKTGEPCDVVSWCFVFDEEPCARCRR